MIRLKLRVASLGLVALVGVALTGCANTTLRNAVIAELSGSTREDPRPAMFLCWSNKDLLRGYQTEYFFWAWVSKEQSDELDLEHSGEDLIRFHRRPLDKVYKGKLTMRADAAQQRLWVVNRDRAEVVATFDRATGTVTGPLDHTPDWADPNGGVELPPIRLRAGKDKPQDG